MKISKNQLFIEYRIGGLLFFKDRNDLTSIYGEKRDPREEKMGINEEEENWT